MSTTELIEKKTIGEVEHIVHASGLWDGTSSVEFSNDGEQWSAAWAPTDEHPHPEYARVTAYRKDVRLPAAPTIRWDEQYPAASEKWAGMWDRSPMRHFGRTVRMIAFRQLFRDILGDIRIEDEADDRDTTAGAPSTAASPDAAPTPERDWEAEYLAATTIEQIDALDVAARSARVFTPDRAGTALHRVARNQRKALVESAWALDHAPEPVADETEPAIAEPSIAAAADVAPAASRPAPQDYLPPQNRAERRAAARKKKGRR